MRKIYFKNAQGRKEFVEVSDEIAKQYSESLREEWRKAAYERYYSRSLEEIIESGRDFEDERTDTDMILELKETHKEQAALINKLKAALPFLTDLQRQTIHKLFFLNMSQAEIAREEGVIESVISRRISRIYRKLQKLIKNF